MNLDDFDEEDLKELKEFLNERRGAKLLWKWLTTFLAVAVPLASLYAFWKSMGGQP